MDIFSEIIGRRQAFCLQTVRRKAEICPAPAALRTDVFSFIISADKMPAKHEI